MTTTPVPPAQLAALRRRAREALRRVNQDYVIWGAVDKINEQRLASVRREAAYLGLTWPLGA